MEKAKELDLPLLSLLNLSHGGETGVVNSLLYPTLLNIPSVVLSVLRSFTFLVTLSEGQRSALARVSAKGGSASGGEGLCLSFS